MQYHDVEIKHSQQKNGNAREAPGAKWTRTLQRKKEDPPRFLQGLLREQQINPAVGARQAVVAAVPPQFSEVVASQVDDDLDRRR